jgi:hypothetical protein
MSAYYIIAEETPNAGFFNKLINQLREKTEGIKYGRG